MTPIRPLQRRLRRLADPSKKAWWEAYLKGAIGFRGVPMAGVRREVAAWLPAEGRVALAMELMRQELAEDKIAGILVLAEHAIPAGQTCGEELLPLLVPLFEEGHIADWNTCDWLCVKALHGLLEREGSVLAPSLASWRDGSTLWQRRAAIVAFVKLAPRGDDNWPGFTAALLESCASNVLDEARFSQTGVGWVLRELSKAEPARVEAFAAAHPLSTEARKMALAKITGRGRR
jgi:3-methyladenine DNA glycosylase AlkD